MSVTAIASHVYSSYKNLYIASKDSRPGALSTLPLPHFEEHILLKLCEDVTAILKNMNSVVYVEPPTYIVGDINGCFYDLIRILGKAESFSTHRFIFLGNYIGKNVFSTECLALIFSLVCLCPHNIILLRGSTEFADISESIGFAQELKNNNYSDALYNAFQNVFNYLPIASIVAHSFLVTHGGLSDANLTLSELITVKRPLTTLSSPIIKGVTSNDKPIDPHFLRSFLRYNGLRKLIHGSFASPKGVMTYIGGKCIAVYSCSCTKNKVNKKNKAGFMFLPDDLEMKGYCLHPYSEEQCRSKASFVDCIMENIEKHKVSPNAFRSIMQTATPGARAKRIKLFKSQQTHSTHKFLQVIASQPSRSVPLTYVGKNRTTDSSDEDHISSSRSLVC